MKSMKKLVLAGLILLASVMVLAGCKNDSVPEVPKYTVTFDKNAEDATGEMTPQTFTQGEKKELTANAFKRSTWTFRGWSEKKDATTPEYKDAAEFTTSKDTTLYAVWRDNGTVSDVTFDSPNGTRFYYDQTVTVALSSDTEGATIKYRLGDENWQDYSEEIPVTSDTTITAKATKEGLKDSAETTATYTVRKLTKISITPPTRTVYSVGELFDSIGMIVTATYDDEEERPVEGTITSETSSLTESAGINKGVTVSYTEGDIEKTDTFTVDVASYPFTETVQDADSSYTGTMSGGTYKKFGDWPQTIMGAGVTVGSGTLVRGGLSYHVGSDGNYYVKAAERANGSGDEYQYSDRTSANQDGTSTRWFKVEPIIWRVLNAKDGKYNESENPLLLAENILTSGIEWVNSKNNYMESNIRKWLNGNSGSGEQSDYNGGAGFLQTAFTETARDQIADTKVDNSVTSTLPNELGFVQKMDDWNDGVNQYACENTTDKIFLLSMQEATKSDYGFNDNASGNDNTRIRVTTDYAKATGAYQSATADYGGWWWLRSPTRVSIGNSGNCIYANGYAGVYEQEFVFSTGQGVVPALCIQLQ